MNWIADLFETAGSSEGWARWQRPTIGQPHRAAQGTRGRPARHGRAAVRAGAPGPVRDGRRRACSSPSGSSTATTASARTTSGSPTASSSTDDRLRRFAVVDLAVSTKTTADYTVIMACGRAKDGRLLVLDVDRARREGPTSCPRSSAWSGGGRRRRVDRADGLPARRRAGGAPGRRARPRADARPRQGRPRHAGHGGVRGRPGAAPALGPLAEGLRDGGACLSRRPVRRPGRLSGLRGRGAEHPHRVQPGELPAGSECPQAPASAHDRRDVRGHGPERPR